MLSIFRHRRRENERPPPLTPTAPSKFLSYLSKHPDTSTRQLVRPYLEYETWLRVAFAKGDPKVTDRKSLVSVYNGREHKFTIRTIDRSENPDKYLMAIPPQMQEPQGAPAIVGSLKEFQAQFKDFTHGVLEGISWSNIVVSGSATLISLLPKREDIQLRSSPAVQNPQEQYYQEVANTSDIDIFIYGIESDQVAFRLIRKLEAVVRKNQGISPGAGVTLRTENTITFVSPRWPHRHVQIILRFYRSITEILTGFDVDCACVAFDGRRVYASPRAVTAISTRTNTVDLTRRSPTYEGRLFKYRKHRFDAFWEELQRTRIQMEDVKSYAEEYSIKPAEVSGLARLVMSERWLADGPGERKYDEYLIRRAVKGFGEARDPELVGPTQYTPIEIPYTVQFTADKLRARVDTNPDFRFICGTIEEMITGLPVEDEHNATADSQGTQGTRNDLLTGPLSFIRQNPGRQKIGSFYPVEAESWADTAYTGLAELVEMKKAEKREAKRAEKEARNREKERAEREAEESESLSEEETEESESLSEEEE